MTTLKFDPNHNLSYGVWQCTCCGNRFYGGGPSIHRAHCLETDYENCIHFVGPKCIERAKAFALIFGEDKPLPTIPSTWAEMKRQLPEIAE